MNRKTAYLWRKRPLLIGFGLAFFLFVLISSGCFLSPAEESLNLTILHTNDHHGHTLAYTYRGRQVGGLAERMSLIERLKEEESKKAAMCLFLDAGDIASGSLFSDFFSAEPDWKLFSEYYDAIVPGNHDFDPPFDTTYGFIQKFRAPVLSANIFDRQSKQLIFPPYKIFQKDKWSIAVIGVSHPDTPLISTRGDDERLEFRSGTDAVSTYVEELREKHDLILILSHLGEDAALAKDVPGIDVVVGGHYHTPLKNPLIVNKTVIVNAGFGGQYIGRLSLAVRRTKGKVETKLEGYTLIPVTADMPPDEHVQEVLQPYLDAFGDRGKTVVGEAGGRFTRPLVDPTSSSTLANLVTDAYRYVTGADFAFVNAGGLRADLEKGPVTVEEIHAVLPFDNTLIVFEITGAQILEVIHSMFSGKIGDGGILFPSNLQITIQDSGSIQVLTGDGLPLEPEHIYRLAVGSFIARGGDGHLSFPNFPNKTDTEIRTSDALKRYFEAKGIVFPDKEPRLKRDPE
jgi:5'-nucleotidase/UDP-sugar diphosphatase